MCICTYTYNTLTYMLTYFLHTHIHVPAIVCIMNMYSYLKVKFILEGGVEVVTLILYSNFRGKWEK